MDSQHRWDAEKESRLIEMFRREYALEEMAKELSLPVDMIEERLAALMEDPEEPGASHIRR